MIRNVSIEDIKKKNKALFQMKGIKECWIEANTAFLKYKDCIKNILIIKFKINNDATLEHIKTYKQEDYESEKFNSSKEKK